MFHNDFTIRFQCHTDARYGWPRSGGDAFGIIIPSIKRITGKVREWSSVTD